MKEGGLITHGSGGHWDCFQNKIVPSLNQRNGDFVGGTYTSSYRNHFRGGTFLSTFSLKSQLKRRCRHFVDMLSSRTWDTCWKVEDGRLKCFWVCTTGIVALAENTGT